MKKKIWIVLIVVVLISLLYYGYTVMMPSSPILDDVPNPIENRATKNWQQDEKKVVKTSLKNAYFGDLHVHTKYSFDAYIGGSTAGPDEAYEFAKGKPINVLNDTVRIIRPLDFAAVTDHSEYLGEMYSAQNKGVAGYFTIAAMMYRQIGSDTAKQRALFNRMRNATAEGNNNPHIHRNFFKGFETTSMAWMKTIEAAEEHYQPGKFTTFIGYEWSLRVSGAHLHRNVIFKDGIVPRYPISAIEAKDEHQLWESLEHFRKSGSTVMAIPHNSNMSHGLTFNNTQADGSPIDLDYVTTRNKNEPLVEIHQAKGSSEVHPDIWTEDEYSNFEIYREEDNPDPNNFIRHVLKRGLKYKEEFGINPYEYGLIGSTDTHNGTPGNTEENDEYQGNHSNLDYSPEGRSTSTWILNGNLQTADAINPGGLVGVWARANTRPEIYEGLKNKETFATSGNRMKIRFFGGAEFEDAYNDYESLVNDGYSKGVPMGQYLKEVKGKPKFILWAVKDALGANLDRIQIIKGWVEEGELREKIIDAIVSENTFESHEEVVNIFNGEINKNYGSATLSGVWADEEFNPDHHAFYYLRVLEVPTVRYTQWDKIKYGTEYPEDLRKTIQERAWSSPIWYQPN